MPIVVGSVSVDVVPNAQNFVRELKAQIEGPVDVLGQEVGQNLSNAVVDHLADAIPEGLAAGVPESAEMGDLAGARFADAFSTQVRTKIDAALKSLPAIDVTADTSDAEGKIFEVRTNLEELSKLSDLELYLLDDQVVAALADLSVRLEEIRADASTPTAIIFDAQQAQDSLDKLILKIEEAKAAAADLAAEMSLDRAVEQYMAEAMAADIDAEKALAQSMADDWEKATQGASGATSSMGLLGPAIAGVALVAVPVFGVLIAGMADLYLGIKNAHVETGNLTSAWQGLEAEAGKEIAPGLQVAVNQLAESLPALYPLIDTLSTDLGAALDKAATWLNNGGAKEIVDYLQTEIPIVAGLFENLGGALAGFISVSQGPANALLETFSKIFDLVGKIEGAFGVVLSGVPVGGSSGSNGAGTSSSSGYVLAQSGDGKSFVQNAQNEIENAPHNILTFLATGGSPTGHDSPITLPGPKLTATQHPDSISAFQHATGNDSYGAQGPTLNAEQMNQATAGLDDNSKALIANAQATNSTIGEYQTAQATAAAFAVQTKASTDALLAEDQAGAALSGVLGKLGTDQLGVAQTSTAFNQAALAVAASLQKNGDAINVATGKLGANSAAALTNQAAVEAAVSAAQAHAEAVGTQTGSVEAMTAAYNADIATLKSQVTGTDAAKQKIYDYIDSIDAIPTLHTTQLEINAAAAEATLANFAAQVNGTAKLTSEALQRSAAAGYTIGQIDNADGNFLQFYADGAHVAQMAPAGAMRVWAEPETGGESYIPHAASKRQRSEAILAETANLFGGAYIPKGARQFADGLVVRGSTGAVGGGGVDGHTHPIHISFDGRKITKVVNEQNGWNGRL